MARKSQAEAPAIPARRFQAPLHVSGVHTFAGERKCDEHGVLEVPGDASEAEFDLILRAGFAPIDGDAQEASIEEQIEEPPVE